MLIGWMGRYVERALWSRIHGEVDCDCTSGRLLERKKKVLAEVVVQHLPNFIMSKLSDYVRFHK